MSAGDLILRGILAVPLLLMLALIGAAGFQVLEPVYSMAQTTNYLGDLTVVMLWASISLIALPLVVILWWWLAPLKSDVRQDTVR